MTIAGKFYYASIFIFLLVSPNLCLAGNWFYQTTITGRVEGEDNRQLVEDDEDGTIGADLSTTIDMSRRTETSLVNLQGRLRSARYDGEAENTALDTDDQELRLNGLWLIPRGEFSLNGSFVRGNTALTELEDSGVLTDVERRVNKSISSQYNYTLIEDTQIFVGANYTDVEFPNAIPVSLNEFNNTGVNGGIIHSINEQSAVTLSASYSEFEGETLGNDIDSTNINLRYNRQLSEKSEAFAGIGYRKSNFTDEFNGITTRSSDTGALYEAGITRQSEMLRLNALIRSDLQPSASGTVNETTRFEFTASKPFSERIRGNLRFIWRDQNSVDDTISTNDREFWSLSFIGQYQINLNWSLIGEYRHREQEFDSSDTTRDAESDAIIFGFRYRTNERNLFQ